MNFVKRKKNIAMLSFLGGIIFAILLTNIINMIQAEATVTEKSRLPNNTESLIKMMDVAPKQIELQLINIQEQKQQFLYNIRLKNNSEYIIKYNNVHLTIPTTTIMFLANNNKLDIQPLEEVMLQVTVTKTPSAITKHSSFALRIDGYFEQIVPSTRFKEWINVKPPM